ncbi:condensation domain-containing protein [Nostoc punctiforme UO1]
MQEIIRRHEALRTTFYMVNGQPFQAITSSLTIRIPVVDLRELPEAQKEAVVQQLITEESQRCFDLVQGPLLRCTLLRIHEQEHIVLFTIHHIVSDGWSMGVFVQELATLYQAFCAGKPSPLPELPIQYADFAIWQKQWLQGEVLEAQLSYWKKQLGSNLPILQLPTVRPRAEVKTSSSPTQNCWVEVGRGEGKQGSRGEAYTSSFPSAPLPLCPSANHHAKFPWQTTSPCATQFFNIPSNLSQQLQALTRQEGATLFMTEWH